MSVEVVGKLPYKRKLINLQQSRTQPIGAASWYKTSWTLVFVYCEPVFRDEEPNHHFFIQLVWVPFQPLRAYIPQGMQLRTNWSL